MRRHLVLPARGTLMVSTDLHGNLDDLGALRGHFERARAAGEDRHWALLGDLVHGPDAETARTQPRLYGFEDQSPEVVEEVIALLAAHPGRVHFVLGNHDLGHVGGAHTSKFHPDEVAALEERMDAAALERMRTLFSRALLAVVAPCGLLLTHGSPGDELTSLAMLDGPVPPEPGDDARHRAVNELLWSYGQKREVAQRLLERLGAEAGHALRVVVHGHDKDEHGWFTEGGNQLQPVVFGAPRENKRFLVVELAGRYETVDDVARALAPVYP